MFRKRSQFILFSLIFSTVAVAGGVSFAFAAGPNLIQNPSMETATIASTTADHWNKGGWGTNTAVLGYPVPGVSGGVGSQVTISAYTSGDAKWYFDNVSVTPSTNYTFSDSYNSNVQSFLVAQITSKTNALSYTQIATLPSTNGAWASSTATFSTPTTAAAVTVFHLIQAKGSLTTDNYFLGTTSGGATSTPTSTIPALSINPSTLPGGTVGTNYSQVLTASTTATGTFTWNFSGTLPSGMVLNSTAGATTTLSGVPLTAGTSTFSIKVTNGASSSTRSYTIYIAPQAAPVTLTINPATLPNGTTSIAYNQTLTASTTATGTFAWTLNSGALPLGLLFTTSTGKTVTIAGTPTATGTASFAIQAVNGSVSSTRNYTITINPPAVVIPTSTPTSTLTVNLTENGGTATSSAFTLSVKSGTSTVFNGSAANTQKFIFNVGTPYTVNEATTTNSASYAISLGANCTGTIGTTSSVCAITNTLASSTPTSTGNLILNASLEADIIASGTPDYWNQGGWGTNNAVFTYPVAGVNGGVGANITISSFTDGDAKWYFNNVTVTPGANYTFSDSYNSNVATALVVQFTSKGGAVSYTQLASLPSTNGAWATTQQMITVPANATAMTVFHLISSVGSLTVDNYFLAINSGGGGSSDLFSKGLVSLTFDDGWQSQYDNALPILQAANMKGSFYIITDGMLNAIETTFPSTDNPFNVATTTKTATWSQIYTDPTQHSFIFSDTYTATGTSTITVSYKTGGSASSTVLGPLPAGTNATANFTFTLPVITGPLTIVQAVTGADTLTATSPLLQQPVGYMDTNHVLGMQAAGEEIGDHTVNHCDLVAIENSSTNTASCAVMPPAQTTVPQQIDDARTALLNAGFTPVDTLAYPYGSGAGNAAVEGAVAADGIVAARSVNTGYNTKSTDHYALLTQSVDDTVTDPATIQQWIDYAAMNKVWLILTFHQIELSSSTITQNKETDATTAAILQSTVSYLQSQQNLGKIEVDTVHDVMANYMN